MAQLAASIVSHDEEFKRQVARLLRAGGVPVGIIEGRGTRRAPPDVVVVDIRADASSGDGDHRAAARRPQRGGHLRVAAAAESRPDSSGDARRRQRVLPLGAGRADPGLARDGRVLPRRGPRQTAARRDATHAGSKQPCVTHVFLGAKGGAGTTTVAVNCAVELARLTKRPTIIVDLKPCLGEVALFLGVRPRFTRARRDREPAPPRQGLPARAGRRSTSPGSTSSPARSSSTARTRRTPARSKSCSGCSAAPTSTSSSTPAT